MFKLLCSLTGRIDDNSGKNDDDDNGLHGVFEVVWEETTGQLGRPGQWSLFVAWPVFISSVECFASSSSAGCVDLCTFAILLLLLLLLLQLYLKMRWNALC